MLKNNSKKKIVIGRFLLTSKPNTEVNNFSHFPRFKKKNHHYKPVEYV